MTSQNPDRTRIFSHITRSRFLHLEDALQPAAPGKPGKIRFFIGSYTKGQGSQATAYHFLDADDARPLMADLSWSKATDFIDYKGSANSGQEPLSRVLKVKGPKDGKYWLEIQNGPGQIIGQGAVKPAGEPDSSISIALTIWEARKLALAVLEYMAAYRVAALLGTNSRTASGENGTQKPEPPMYPGAARTVNPATGEISDVEELFGPEPAPSGAGSGPERTQKAEATRCETCGQQLPHHAPSCRVIAARKADAAEAKRKEEPAEVDPPVFFALANKAIAAGFPLDRLQEIIHSQVPWREKHISLQAAMAA